MPHVDRDARRKYDREWRASKRTPETTRRNNLKYSYGITVEQYDEMLDAQGGVCAICGVDNPGRNKRWNVDHCHTSKKVRGLLCNHCNTGLGLFRDNPAFLSSAINYLNRH